MATHTAILTALESFTRFMDRASCPDCGYTIDLHHGANGLSVVCNRCTYEASPAYTSRDGAHRCPCKFGCRCR